MLCNSDKLADYECDYVSSKRYREYKYQTEIKTAGIRLLEYIDEKRKREKRENKRANIAILISIIALLISTLSSLDILQTSLESLVSWLIAVLDLLR